MAGEESMSDYIWPLSKVLDSIGSTTDMTVEDYLDEGEWFRLAPYRMRDEVLFQTLSNHWDGIVFPTEGMFALVHCQSGRQRGVWLHYLGTDSDREEYLCGCFQIPDW